MGHDHSHAGHSHAPAGVATRTLAAAVVITLLFSAGEAAAGWWAHSLALLSDALHNLADSGALALSWYGLRIAARPSHHGMTFGYHRVGILAALVNALSLVVIAVFIGWESVDRFLHPQPASGLLMVVVAAAAVVVNTVISLWLRKGAANDLNVRSAYLHMVGDAVSSGGVLVAGAVVMATGSTAADPVVSFVIAGLILWSSWGLLRQTTAVLLEGTPPGTDMDAVVSAISGVRGVINVHDLHVWMVGPGVVACSCHILVAEQSIREGRQVLRAVVREVEQRFGISHTTVQVEVEGCEATDMYCNPQRLGT